MFVSEIIDTVSFFTFGTLATKRQREDYLRCLNFANNEIYLSFRNYKKFLKYEEIEVLLDNSGYYIDIDLNKIVIKSIYNMNKKLKSFDLLTNEYLKLSENEYLKLYSDKKIYFGATEFNKDITNKNIIKVFYLEPLKKLTENPVNVNETDISIYDDDINHVLILGTIYYIFLTTNGQLNKLQSSYNLYKEKLADILKYYEDL